MAGRDGWYGDANFEARGGRLVLVDPVAYLAAVRPLEIDEVSRENIDILKAHMEAGKTLDPLAIYADGKEDGRHRAHASVELGIAAVPVIAFGDWFSDAEPVDSESAQQGPSSREDVPRP